MLDQRNVREAIGQDLYSGDDEKIGRIGQVYLDDETDRPEFLTVHTGVFGTNESFVPATGASYADGRVTVPFGTDKVKDAPTVSVDDRHLGQDQERELSSYDGLPYSDATSDTGLPTGGTGGQDASVGHDTSGPTTDEAMTRSEEHARVGTSEEGGRARLRKYVATEETTSEETVSAEVRKERIEAEGDVDRR